MKRNYTYSSYTYEADPQIKLEQLKSRIEPRSFYEAEGLSIKSNHNAWVLAGLCPFHDDRSEGSFYINLDTGAFNCFSCGSKGGDIIAFRQKRDELSFQQAIQQLNNEWRI